MPVIQGNPSQCKLIQKEFIEGKENLPVKEMREGKPFDYITGKGWIQSFAFLSFLSSVYLHTKRKREHYSQETTSVDDYMLTQNQFSTILGPIYGAPNTKKSSGFSSSSNHAYPSPSEPSSFSTETKKSRVNEANDMTLLGRSHTSEPESGI